MPTAPPAAARWRVTKDTEKPCDDGEHGDDGSNPLVPPARSVFLPPDEVRDDGVERDEQPAGGEDDAGAELVRVADAVPLVLGEVGDKRQEDGGGRADEQRGDVETARLHVVRTTDDRHEPVSYTHLTLPTILRV